MKTSIMNEPSKKVTITKYTEDWYGRKDDVVVVEEPLEIRLIYGTIEERKSVQVAVIMRTPGEDEALAIGFLFNEGIIQRIEDILTISKKTYWRGELNPNIISIALQPEVPIDPTYLQRNMYASSSCGICGKASLDAIHALKGQLVHTDAKITTGEILFLENQLRSNQPLFDLTGGNHAMALFTHHQLIALAEDVGRHNALDKLAGRLLRNHFDKAAESVLLLSGRASFELLQKAAVIGIPFVCAIGAPSSLAIDIAIEFNITLIGFLKLHSFNIYSHDHRVIVTHDTNLNP